VESAEGFVEDFSGVEVFTFAHEGGEQGEVILGLLLGAGVIEAESCGRAGGQLAAAAF
jgi:hypothetical protein